MKLHTVFVTYNRLDLTKQAIASYLETVNVSFTFSVVDNNSSDGTKEWITSEWSSRSFGDPFHTYSLLDRNRYPGFATNHGWAIGPSDATFLQRADNDHVFLPGWCDEVARVFTSPKIGLVGLRTSSEEEYTQYNTGGNCVIRRELWDKGLRWDERPWPQLRDEVGAGYTEDSLICPAVKRMGYTWTRVRNPCVAPISPETPDDPDWPYYLQSWADRGIHSDLRPDS